jgi:muramoyltetrapeptide carboxypeptidase
MRIVPGKARGRLVGGNISVFATLVGTPFEPPLEGRILFLEEVAEEPYRIDRWLTHFLLTGKLAGCAGIALGRFHDCGPRELQQSYGVNGTYTWREVAAERLGSLGIPVVSDLVFGHVSDKATIPVGVLAELDGDAGTLTLLEPAVR